jgi:hypothetical protein
MPDKRLKLTEKDLYCGENYSLYANAYGQILEKTCTKEAPWWIIPADHKAFRNMLVTEILVGTLERMGLSWHDPDPVVAKSELWKKPSAAYGILLSILPSHEPGSQNPLTSPRLPMDWGVSSPCLT